ncbi:MAG: glycosyltransferase, partial [Gemmataceae bacterium]
MQSNHSPKLLISVATYNEAENIEALIGSIRQYAKNADILVVDDASPDGTGIIAESLAVADPRVRVIHRSGKLGLGTAMLRAMEHAVQNHYDLLLTMDADFSH